jgi:hypothetical protein
MRERAHFPLRVVRVFDRFVKLKLPVPVNPFEDLYRRAFTDKAWVAMCYLRQARPEVLVESQSFDVHIREGCRAHLCFQFPTLAPKPLPGAIVNLWEMPMDVRDPVMSWANQLRLFVKARRALHIRVEAIMGNVTNHRQFSMLDPACNTPGQIVGVWPELQPFFPAEWRDAVRSRKQRFRPPKFVGLETKCSDGSTRWATPEEFRCEDYKATIREKREWSEINEVLRLMALAGDIPDPPDYPTLHDFHKLD